MALCFLFLIPFTCFARNGVNPFMVFAGKPYGEIHYALRDTLKHRYVNVTPECLTLTVRQLREIPDTYHNGQWKIESEFFDLNFRHDHQKTLSDKDFEAAMMRLIDESKKYNNKVWQLRITRRLFDFYIDTNRQYDMAIYARQMERFFGKITSEEFPDVIDYKMKLATVYMKYNDYARAEKYFREVISAPIIIQIQEIYPDAYNGLGLIYRKFHHDLNASDRYFRSILTLYKKKQITILADEWKTVVTGNLGTNQLIRDNFKVAEKLLTEAFKARYAMKDYNYSFIMAYELADCYCETDRCELAKRYLQTAEECYRKSAESMHSLVGKPKRENYFIVLSKYYTAVGERDKSYQYLDSANVERIKYDLQFNTTSFLIVEQKESNREYRQEQIEKRTYAYRFFFSSVAGLFVLILFSISVRLYLKKRAAYNLLVKQNRLEADKMLFVGCKQPKNVPDSKASNSINISYDDKSQIKKVMDYIAQSQCYLDSDLNINVLARKVGLNRTYISNVINADGSNFTTFINRYRVSYAIHLLSLDNKISMERVAIMSGFNSRKSMYNAFKVITGLSPSQFSMK